MIILADQKRKRMPTIAILGAGSIVFSKAIISDVLAHDALQDSQFNLMDIDPERLTVVEIMGRSINETRGASATFLTYGDISSALEGADFIITTFGIGGFEATKTDILIPKQYGIRQPVSDTLCMGGIFRSARSIPIMLTICDLIEEICPNALLLNYVNPMATHCLAIQRATTVNAVGLCHGTQYTRGRMIMLAELAEMDEARKSEILDKYEPTETGAPNFMDFYRSCVWNTEYETLCAGINHMAAFLLFRKNGVDMYPKILEAMQDPRIWDLERVRLELLKHFGYFMTETSGHISEYLPWFLHDDGEIERMWLRPESYIPLCEKHLQTLQEYKQAAESGAPFITPDEPITAEHCSRVINAVVTDTPFLFNGNVHNQGGSIISNLPGDCCVEVPCVATRTGIHPTVIGDLPPQIAAMIRTNVNVQDLIVEAVLEENVDHLYHAALFDPNSAASATIPQIRACVDEMRQAQKEWLPPYFQ